MKKQNQTFHLMRDIDHLATFNKNGLWIKENLVEGQRIISAKRDDAKIKNCNYLQF